MSPRKTAEPDAPKTRTLYSLDPHPVSPSGVDRAIFPGQPCEFPADVEPSSRWTDDAEAAAVFAALYAPPAKEAAEDVPTEPAQTGENTEDTP